MAILANVLPEYLHSQITGLTIDSAPSVGADWIVILGDDVAVSGLCRMSGLNWKSL